MNINEIKKALYKEKPIAKATRSISYTQDGELGQEYLADCSLGRVRFVVPMKDKSLEGFKSEEQAQLLIRWLYIIQ